jgi:hypothetical protein
MTRDEYQRYADAFNAGDYDAVYDHYAQDARLAFFGLDIRNREQFKHFYGVLHAHVIETLTIERFASSAELVALEGVIRVEATKALTVETLQQAGLPVHFAIEAGEVREMRQYIHYHLDAAGKFQSVGCALA